MNSLLNSIIICFVELPPVMVPCIGTEMPDHPPMIEDYSQTVPTNADFPIDPPFCPSGKLTSVLHNHLSKVFIHSFIVFMLS